MALGAFELARTPPVPDPETAVTANLRNREANFLETVQRIVFGNPANPYFQMFKNAGCSFGDLESSVRANGLENTLETLFAGGVYLTHDEFKGKTPIVRSGRQIASDAESFKNPYFQGHIESSSSGSRSNRTRTRHSLQLRIYRESHQRNFWSQFEGESLSFASLSPVLPAASGITQALRARQIGYRLDRWYNTGGSIRDAGHYRAVTWVTLALGNLAGARAPFPVHLPQDDFTPVAEWIAGERAKGNRAFVRGFVSPSVRVAAVAIAKGLDIRGAIFQVGGEALTEAKREVIEAAGAEVFPGYWIHEIGPIGQACRETKKGNCVHVFDDMVAVITQRRKAPLTDAEVNALHFTTLLPFASNVLINACMDDAGVLGAARCSCSFSAMGFTRQLSEIASFGKLTGHGVTLVGTDIVRILEKDLPAQLGGTPGDYQLVEMEGGTQTRLVLRVSPRVRADPARARTCFLEALKQSYGGHIAVRLWQHTGAFEVALEEPLTTMTGKVLPLYLLGSGAALTAGGSAQ